MTVAQLVAQLQALPQDLPVTAFSHKECVDMAELYSAELFEAMGTPADLDYVPESVTLHFDV
jgi:hypothetical protein